MQNGHRISLQVKSLSYTQAQHRTDPLKDPAENQGTVSADGFSKTAWSADTDKFRFCIDAFVRADN